LRLETADYEAIFSAVIDTGYALSKVIFALTALGKDIKT
jgi:hypothetical protein